MLRQIWTDFLALILRRPSRYQVAALCWREGTAGLEILLISSLNTGRWILPKGWPMMGRNAAETALQEAWEEAGIRIGARAPEQIGRYSYQKRLSGDVPAHTMVDVYAIPVDRLLETYPEAGQRKREWFSPEAAAGLVDEPELAALLRNAATLIQRQTA